VTRHRHQRGLGRGCAVLIGAALVVVLLLVYGYVRATSTPDLGAPPRGPEHGQDQRSIAVSMAARLAPGLLLAPHATVSVSEQDLTVIIRENDSEPDRFRDPEARVRDGKVVIDAHTSVGPLSVIAVARLGLALATGNGQPPDVRVDIAAIDAGSLSLPWFVRDAIRQRIESSVTLNGVFSSNPDLNRLRPFLDCVAVTSQDVLLGFHRPGTDANPQGCSQPSA
jgi:hypothetical protein